MALRLPLSNFFANDEGQIRSRFVSSLCISAELFVVKTWAAIVIGSVISIAILWLTSIPLGVPGEWTWQRVAPEPDTFWNLYGGAVAAALIIAFVLFVRRRLDGKAVSSWMQNSYLVGLVIVSFAWIWIVQEISPVQNRFGKSAFVLYYASSSGYFTRARYEQPSSSDLLAHYEELMSKGDVLHTGTHPPGLFLVFHGLITVCERSSLLASFLDATQPESFREACDIIASFSTKSQTPRPLLPLDRHVLWLATLLVMLAASATVVPLYYLVRRHCSPVDAWSAAALWPAIPAVAVFVPKSDAMFPMIGVLFLFVWLAAWDRRSFVLALIAGLIAWCGLVCSLAFLPIFLVAALISIGSMLVEVPRRFETPRLACIAFAGLGFGLPTLLIWFTSKANMITIWLHNYRNHANFYREYSRTYWQWLLVNPVELSFAAGWPVAILALLAVISLLRSTEGQSTQRRIDLLSITFVWGLLWLTGKNSGEAARLWLIFMPWLIWLASDQISALVDRRTDIDHRQRSMLFLLVAQFTVCLLTVSRLNGFHILGG